MKKVLVTGATGFIGNYVINELLKNQNISVVASSRSQDKAEKCEWFHRVIYVSYDVEQPLNVSLSEHFHEPDCLIHLAWDGLNDYDDFNHTDHYLFQHYRFIKQLIREGLRDISVSGTCLEVGLKEGCFNENISTSPVTNYGLAKDCLRKFLELNARNNNISFKWIRLFYLFGDGQRNKSLMGHLKKAIRENSKTFPMSGGEQLRDYLPIEIAANYIVHIALQKNIQGVINCCKGQPISVRRFVENYLNESNVDIELDLGKYPYPKHEPFAFWGDKSKLNLVLNGN